MTWLVIPVNKYSYVHISVKLPCLVPSRDVCLLCTWSRVPIRVEIASWVLRNFHKAARSLEVDDETPVPPYVNIDLSVILLDCRLIGL